MVTGKGGIGKTLVSNALAHKAISLGKKVCLVESSAHDQIAPLYGVPPVGHNLREISPGLFIINLNPQDNFRDFVIKHLGFAKLFEKVFTKPIVRSFIQMMPGIAELTLLGRLYYFSELDEEHKFDTVILDGFASGHFHSLMKTPDAVLHSGMVGPIIQETQRVRDFVSDPTKTAVALVAVAEELVISEALDFISRLQKETAVPLRSVIVNRCFPQWKPDAGPLPEELKKAVAYGAHRQEDEAKNIRRLHAGMVKRPEDKDLILYKLQDLGAFPEPLEAATLLKWIDQAERV